VEYLEDALHDGELVRFENEGFLVQETITAKPGIYVEVCFMDVQDARSHSQLGMERIIKIVK
jgi:hypothetical protein